MTNKVDTLFKGFKTIKLEELDMSMNKRTFFFFFYLGK